MYLPVYTKQFEKDVRLAKKRGKDLEKLKSIIAIRRHSANNNAAPNHVSPDYL